MTATRKDPLPPEFVAWLKGYILSAQFSSPRRLFRGLVLRWCLWQDGVTSNGLPGYAACPKPCLKSGLPAGWSQRTFSDLARETLGTERVYQARKAAAVAATRRDCGADHPYGICPVCGKGHGHILYQDGKPSSLITDH